MTSCHDVTTDLELVSLEELLSRDYYQRRSCNFRVSPERHSIEETYSSAEPIWQSCDSCD